MTGLTGARSSGRRLRELYNRLLKEYGPQGWWPVKGKYRPGVFRPRTGEECFEIAAGALLTQNTNWGNAARALEGLRAARLLSPRCIIRAPLPKLEKAIRPAGYYRQKAGRLKGLAKAYLSLNARMGTEELRERLLAVKGVGEETADSILLYAYGRPVFVIDAYTKRICEKEKLFKGKTYSEYQRFFEGNLPRKAELFNEFHALIVEWNKRERRKL